MCICMYYICIHSCFHTCMRMYMYRFDFSGKSQDSDGHPEGPNIGYNSNSSWFDNQTSGSKGIYIYIYIYIFIYTSIHIYIYMYIYMYTYMHMNSYAYMSRKIISLTIYTFVYRHKKRGEITDCFGRSTTNIHLYVYIYAYEFMYIYIHNYNTYPWLYTHLYIDTKKGEKLLIFFVDLPNSYIYISICTSICIHIYLWIYIQTYPWI
jgi:hypothetical protein